MVSESSYDNGYDHVIAPFILLSAVIVTLYTTDTEKTPPLPSGSHRR